MWLVNGSGRTDPCLVAIYRAGGLGKGGLEVGSGEGGPKGEAHPCQEGSWAVVLRFLQPSTGRQGGEGGWWPVLTCTRPLRRPWRSYRGLVASSGNRERLRRKHSERELGAGSPQQCGPASSTPGSGLGRPRGATTDRGMSFTGSEVLPEAPGSLCCEFTFSCGTNAITTSEGRSLPLP